MIETDERIQKSKERETKATDRQARKINTVMEADNEKEIEIKGYREERRWKERAMT